MRYPPPGVRCREGLSGAAVFASDEQPRQQTQRWLVRVQPNSKTEGESFTLLLSELASPTQPFLQQPGLGARGM